MSLKDALALLGAKTSVFREEQWPSLPGTSVAFYDGTFSDYLNVYRTQPAIRQVVAFIAENMAAVPIIMRQKVSESERRTVDDHPVSRLLKWPNPEYSQYEFMRDLVTDLEIFDVTFWQLATVSNGSRYAFRMYPDAVEIIESDTFGPKTFRYHRNDGTYKDLDRSEVLYLHGYGSARGISPMETLKRIIQEDQAAGTYREGMYRNGMRNAGVIERPLDAPDWSDAGRERFLTQLADRHSSNKGLGRPLLLEEGMTWKSDQISNRSEEYVASREFSTRAVANAYRISPAILGLTDAPYASITAYNQQLYQNALASRLTFITQGLERQLLSTVELADEQIYIEFNLSAKLRGSFQEQAAIAQAAVGKPWMTVDEWRAMMELKPMEEQDAPRFADVGLPALVDTGIVSAAWAAEQVGAPTEGLPTVPERVDQFGSSDPAPASGDNPGPDPSGAAETDQPAPSEQPLNEPKSRKAKERGAVARREKYAARLYEVLEPTMERATSSAKAHGTAGLKADRWAREISADLEPVMREIVVAEGTRKYADFDPDYVVNYVKAGAKRVGENIGGKISEAAERHEGNADGMLTALTAMAARVAQGSASNLMGFARQEAGKQRGLTKKTWTVTNPNSRHPELDGETVKLGATFSNGLAYPGDPTGDADDNANCQCVLDIS